MVLKNISIPLAVNSFTVSQLNFKSNRRAGVTHVGLPENNIIGGGKVNELLGIVCLIEIQFQLTWILIPSFRLVTGNEPVYKLYLSSLILFLFCSSFQYFLAQ